MEWNVHAVESALQVKMILFVFFFSIAQTVSHHFLEKACLSVWIAFKMNVFIGKKPSKIYHMIDIKLNDLEQ